MSNDEDYHMLGAALFGPSAHHPSPPQCLPEAWRSSLTRNHLDAHSRQTVFQSCVSGRDLVLEVAEQASLRITWHTAWPRQLSLFNRSLQTRGALPTTLIISCDDQVLPDNAVLSPPRFLIISKVVEHLKGAAQGLTTLSIQQTTSSPDHAILSSNLLLGPCRAFTSLASLQLRGCAAVLPPSPALAALTHLSVNLPTHTPNSSKSGLDAVCDSIAAYTGQITSLTLSHSHTDAASNSDPRSVSRTVPWSRLFSAARPSRTLTTLSVPDCTLTDELVELLLDSAPGVTALTVGEVGLVLDTHRDRQWAVGSITVVEGPVQAVRLARLPSSVGGRLWAHVRCSGGVEMPDVGLQGIDPAVRERLPHWQLDVGCVSLQPDTASLSDTNQPAALRTALHHLADTHTSPGTHIALRNWQWGPETAQVLATTLPTLPQSLSFTVSTYWPLTDGLLSTALLMGPCVRGLSVGGVLLNTEQHAGAPWPWAEGLSTETLNVWDVTKLPVASEGHRGMIRCAHVAVNSAQLLVRLMSARFRQVLIEGVTSRLQHIRFTPNTQTSTTLTIHVPEPYTQNAREVDTNLLHAYMSVLKAVQFDSTDTERVVCVRLHNWPMTNETMVALRGLPHWAGTLDLTGCTWALRPGVYRQLAACVPESYARWELQAPPVQATGGAWSSGAATKPSVLLESICEGINKRRAARGMQRLTYQCVSGTAQTQTQTQGKHAAHVVQTGAHVVITPYRG